MTGSVIARENRSIRASLFALLVFATSMPASGYDVWPKKSTHEAMTLLAQQCLADAGEREPVDCRPQFARLAGLTANRPLMGYDDLQISVRWADDPARQVPSGGIFRFGYNMLGRCERLTRPGRSGAIPRLDQAGLLCSSHYGRLQFLHAQAVYGENDDLTRARIIDWAVLTYRIAIGDVSPTERICAHFRNEPSGIASSFELDARQCDHGNDGAWTFTTLLASGCTNPASSRICPQIPTAAATNALAVRTARGALLHVIQDSYSQSHAARGPVHENPNRYDNRVDCSLPSHFHSFYRQRGHKLGDRVPELAGNCRMDDWQADDVITASAMALHHIERRVRPAVFSCYLQRRVFGRRPRLPGEAEPAACPTNA